MATQTVWSRFVTRSAAQLRERTTAIMTMAGADDLPRHPRTLFTFNSAEDVAQMDKGCDRDIGGLSTVHLALDEDPDRARDNGGRPSMRFWGDMKTGVKEEFKGRRRGGYAAFRNQKRYTIFGEMMEDTTLHEYLHLRLRVSGHPLTRGSYFVNLQDDGPIRSDLWQHRLYFHRDDGGWEDHFIPFDSFVLTNTGVISHFQSKMFRLRMRSVGISLLGGHSSVEGPYELGIDSIRLVNEEHVTVRPIVAQPSMPDPSALGVDPLKESDAKVDAR